MKKRETKYDYLRSLAVISIVTVHSIPSEPTGSFEWWFIAGAVPVLLSFVGIYFMMSGLFLLCADKERLSVFYRKRFLTVVVPFLLFSLIYYGYDACKNPLGKSLAGHGISFIKEVLEGTVPMTDHMWFLYALMALYLCTPFLARMFANLKDSELKWFLILTVGAQGLITYLPVFGIQIGGSLDYMIFTGWTMYYVLGYGLKRLCRREHLKTALLLGALGLTVTLLQKKFTPGATPGIHDLALTMTAMSSAIFLTFEFMGEGKRQWPGRLAFFVSRHSYGVYLIHYLVLHGLTVRLTAPVFAGGHFLTGILLTAGGTFLASLAIAYVLDTAVIFPLQRKFKTVMNEENKNEG